MLSFTVRWQKYRWLLYTYLLTMPVVLVLGFKIFRGACDVRVHILSIYKYSHNFLSWFKRDNRTGILVFKERTGRHRKNSRVRFLKRGRTINPAPLRDGTGSLNLKIGRDGIIVSINQTGQKGKNPVPYYFIRDRFRVTPRGTGLFPPVFLDI